MPQIGFKCVKTDENKSFDDCIDCSRSPDHCEFPPEMLIGIRRIVQPRSVNPMEPSITLLCRDCVRQSVIESNFDFYVSPRKLYPAFRGTMIHRVLEAITTKDSWTEQTHQKSLTLDDGKVILVSGRPDKIVPSQKLIRDYKTTVRVPTKDEPYGKHAEQLNGYRWLWCDLFEIDKLRLQYIDMRNTKQVKVPLMPVEQVEAYLKEQALVYVNCMLTNTVPLGEYNTKNWICRYCDVTDICQEITSWEVNNG